MRLPKCKHVFGDHCIKKWFEDNDTCPYCRDHVPSEPQFRHSSQYEVLRYMRQHHAQMQAIRQYQSREANATASHEALRFVRSSGHVT